MLGSKRLCLISFVIIFGLFTSLLFIAVSNADPLVISGSNGSNQMAVGSSQTLTASGGCCKPYTWSLGGGGSISSSSGDSTTYTAPGSNSNCNNNPTICVTDFSGQQTCKQIAVSSPSISGDAYAEYSAAGLNPIHDSGCHYCPSNEYSCTCWDCSCLRVQCSVQETDFDCMGNVTHECTTGTSTYGWCVPCDGDSCYDSVIPDYASVCRHARGGHIRDLVAGSPVDVRTDAMKTAGCCPPQFLPPPPPPLPPTPCPNDTGCGKNSVSAESSANLKSGNLYHSQDVAKLALSYNSIDTINDVLGIKWTHNYNQQLTASSNKIILKLKTEDGNTIYFKLSGGIYYPSAVSGDTSQIVKNSDGTYTRTAKNGMIENYNSSGNLTSIIDLNGNTTTLTYSGGYLASITDQNSRTTTITTTGGKIASITDPGGRTYNLAYTNGLLTSITDPLGNTWRYTYDANGKMLTKTDPANFVITYTYDANGNLLTSTDPEGKTRTMNYTQSGTTTFTEKDGGLWTYIYDPVYAVKTAQTDPLGNTTRYTYDAKRNLLSTTAPDGSVTRNTYDANSNLTSVTDPLGNVTSYTYNSLNLVTSMTDPKGNKTQYGYDAQGNRTSVTDATNAVTRYQYDAKGNNTAIINPLNKTTNMTYDQYNNLITVTDPKGGTVTMAYDNVGNMLRQTDALGKVITFQYNSLNQMTQITDPLGKITQYTYDYKGNRLSTTDANTNTTQYLYDYKSQLTKITDALNNITNMAYSGAGCSSCGTGVDKLTALTDAKNQTTAYEYDKTGKLTKETDPLGKITTHTYDSKGNLITRTSPDNKTITYSYDLIGRLTQKTYSDSAITTFQYDNAGNMTYAGNQNINYTFTYDAVSRITQISDSAGRIIQYQYDAAGNRTTMITPDGRTINYVYDFDNLLTQITTDLGNFTFTYDANNRRITRTLPNGTTATYSYDQGSRLVGIQTTKGATTIDSVGYTYDNVGNRLTKAQPPVNYNYTYDALYRLTQATPTGGTQQPETYTYDPVGNRLLKVPDTPPSANETVNYTYDDENRLTGVQITRNYKTKALTFTYDPFGKRISKTLTKDEIGTDCTSPNICPRTTNYVYDKEKIILEYDQTGSISAKYTHGPGIDEPLALEKNKQTYYYHTDGLGSITTLTNASGNIVQTYSYDSFGNMTATGNINQPFTFTAREYDQEMGLYYYRARYYDPKVGRFVTKDPIGFRGGDANLYGYVKNNPVNYTDPKGSSVIDCLMFVYYARQCLNEGLECKKKVCQENENATSSDLFNECYKNLPSCQKKDEYAVKCNFTVW